MPTDHQISFDGSLDGDFPDLIHAIFCWNVPGISVPGTLLPFAAGAREGGLMILFKSIPDPIIRDSP